MGDFTIMSIGAYGNIPNNVGLTALNQLSNQWWNAPQINNWGQYPDTQGNFPKPDINFILEPRTPIAAILPGVVTGVNQPPNKNLPFPAYGAVVTVKMDQPLNSLATHYALLHLQVVTVQVGQRVRIGDVLGYGGGNQTQGSAPAAVGFALYPGDYYGYGQEWTRYIQTANHVANPLLNPTSLINDITSGNVTSYLNNNGTAGGFNLSSLFSGNGASTGASTVQKVAAPLIDPNESVATTLMLMDEYLYVENPIPQGSFNITQFPDWLAEFFQVLGYDFVAIIFRMVMMLLGLYICFKVIDSALKGSISRGARNVTSGTAKTIEEIAPFIAG